MNKNNKTIGIIGASSGWGAKIRSTEQGPEIVKALGLLSLLKEKNIKAIWLETVYPEISELNHFDPSAEEIETIIYDFNARLFAEVSKAVENKNFPLVIGGDHSMAIATWNAIAQTKDDVNNFGLIWIDAHMDSHTQKSSQSHAMHGMPVSFLLKHSQPSRFDHGGEAGVIDPKHMVLIGIRSYEAEEEEFLKSQNVRVYYMDEVKSRGFKVVLEEAIRIVTKETFSFGVSIDLDAFDPVDAPGVGTPAKKGLRKNEVLNSIGMLAQNEKFCGLEIAEFNPTRDIDEKTSQLIIDLILTTLGGNNATS